METRQNKQSILLATVTIVVLKTATRQLRLKWLLSIFV